MHSCWRGRTGVSAAERWPRLFHEFARSWRDSIPEISAAVLAWIQATGTARRALKENKRNGRKVPSTFSLVLPVSRK
ncbi:hypothetical protein TMatcc_008989 [Talaromyces marneffei ATCC 18224]